MWLKSVVVDVSTEIKLMICTGVEQVRYTEAIYVSAYLSVYLCIYLCMWIKVASIVPYFPSDHVASTLCCTNEGSDMPSWGWIAASRYLDM